MARIIQHLDDITGKPIKNLAEIKITNGDKVSIAECDLASPIVQQILKAASRKENKRGRKPGSRNK